MKLLVILAAPIFAAPRSKSNDDLTTLLENLYRQYYSQQKQYVPNNQYESDSSSSQQKEPTTTRPEEPKEDEPIELPQSDDSSSEYEYIEYYETTYEDFEDEKQTSEAIKKYFKSQIQSQAREPETEFPKSKLLENMLTSFESLSSTHHGHFPSNVHHYFDRISKTDANGQVQVDRQAVKKETCSISNPNACVKQSFKLNKLHRYGCWCFQGDLAGKGRGTPVNAIDRACKNRSLCKRCIKIDDSTCNSQNTTYTTPNHVDIYESNDHSGEPRIGDLCDELNDDTCSYMNCACDVQFTIDIMDIWFGGQNYEPEFHHDEGFNWELECNTHPTPKPSSPKSPGSPNTPGGPTSSPGPTSGPKPTKPPMAYDCCGEFPRRFPYASSKSECCAYEVTHDDEVKDIYKIFNPENKQCCANGLKDKFTDCDES